MKSRLTNLSETWTSRSECAGRDGHVAQLPPHGCVKVVLHVYPAQRSTFYFLFIARCTSCSLLRIVLAGPAAPSGASRVPPPTPSCRAARRSPLPVAGGSRAGATTRRARPSASGRGERLKSAARPPRRGGIQASTARPTTTRATRRPSVRREIRNRFTRRKRKSASARPVDTGARREPATYRAPCGKGRSARERGNAGGAVEAIPGSRPIAPAGLQKYRRCGFHA
jgi:hypothetical protein